MIPLYRRSRIMSHDEKLPVIREGTAAGTNVVYVDGKPVKRNPLRFAVSCNVQPIGAKDLLLVPEGDRYTEQFWMFAENLDVVLQANDKVLRGGKVYQVQVANTWGSFTQARIMAIDVGPEAVAFDDNPVPPSTEIFDPDSNVAKNVL